MKRTLLTLGLALIAAPSFAQLLPGVSDADANGRDIIHLGSLNTGSMFMKADCAADLARGAKCTVFEPQPQITSFNHLDIISLRIPARATNSLLCFDITPLIEVDFANLTGIPTTFGAFSAAATLTIRSPVLNDLTIVQPHNGQPYNGKFDIGTVQFSEQVTLAANEATGKSYHWTRSCGSASVSKHALTRFYGLTAAQANSFFNNPITVVLNARADVRYVDQLQYHYHVRLYGDRR
jgi:hypothetical protein